MARFFLPGRSRRADAAGEPPAADAPRRPLTGKRIAPTPGALRRERRALMRARDERIRDLGGLMLEMYRRDHYREELVFERCAELLSLEERILELDELVRRAGRRAAAAGTCACGAQLVAGIHFCANCGRPAGAPLVGCPHCGRPLPADANFCAACGTAALELADRPVNGGLPPADSDLDLWEQ